MDIVDTQVHVGRGKIDATLCAMDALGIRSLLIDEFWGEFSQSHPSHIQPGHLLPNGAWRAAWPTATEASLLHPDRFGYLVRIDPRDPELECVMRSVASSPGARAFRLQPVWTMDEARSFAEGSHDAVLDLAQDIGLPVCFFVPGFAEAMPRYIARYPRLTFVIDHCGMGFPTIPFDRPEQDAARTLEPAYFDEVLKLAEHPNVILKWSHAQDRFGIAGYPYEPLRPLLRKAIAAFGADRIMWASDNTVLPHRNWADMLTYLRDEPELDAEEKRWILGATARKVLRWSDVGGAPSAS
ncbi:amidohydrolase family protein [Novosphingobium sp. M1R2S20]|uniref:Amidohydrolase n=1 Tax=Novosphingobium rhizovicinum TaxID=3228928 RepID=A0ABV3RAZ3_9SPHN